MNYITSKPVITDNGTARVVSRAELLRSPHAEVRQGAARFRGFVFGGVTFVPMIAESAYSGRASLPGFPGVADPRQPSQKTLLPHPVPPPTVPAKPIPPQPRKPSRPRPWKPGTAAAVVACGLLLAILGVALWPRAEQPKFFIASPMCDSRVEVCP